MSPTPISIIGEYLRRQIVSSLANGMVESAATQDRREREEDRSDLFEFAIELTRSYAKAVLQEKGEEDGNDT